MSATRVTPVGRVVLLVIVLLYLAALTSQSGLLLTVVGILAGCMAVNFFASRRAISSLALDAPATSHLAEGQSLWQPWVLANQGKHPAALIEVESPAGRLFRHPGLAPSQQAQAVPKLVYWKRGVYGHDQIELSSSYPFGLLRARRSVKLAGEVVVCPSVYPTATPRGAGYGPVVRGKHAGQRRSSSGIQFAGVRPLQPGDPFRQIHWPSSAKGRGLMVRTYDEELSGRAGFIIDAGHSGDSKQLDDCIRAAGSLIFAALDAGHQVEWVDLGALGHRVLPPSADGHEVLDSLARILAAPECLTLERLESAIGGFSRKAAIHLLVTQFNPAVESALRLWGERKRQVQLYVPAGVPAQTSGVAVGIYTAHDLIQPAE